MSNIKLIQRIRDITQALQTARAAADRQAIETLEDMLFDLEEQLERDETNAGKHSHEWL